MHAVVQKQVSYSESFEPALKRESRTIFSPTLLTSTPVTTVYGQTLEIVSAPDKVLVSDAELVEPDIYASNGVLHTISSLLIPPDALQLTPEKFLLTYHCTTFLSLLRSVDLTHLVNDTDTKYTILAPQDDVIALFGENDLPERGSDELRDLLRYHFLPGRWTPKHLKDADLLETALVEDGLDGGRQVLQVEVTSKGDKKSSSSSIRFGGASVVSDHRERFPV